MRRNDEATRAPTIRVLGPVVIEGPARSTALRRQERLLLGILYLELGNILPSDRLIDLLWPTALPARPTGALQVYMCRIRRALNPVAGLTLDRNGDGYALRPTVDQSTPAVDAAEFRALIRDATSLSPAPACARLRRALDLWRGPALAGAAVTMTHRAICRPIETERLVAMEHRFRLELALDRHVETIADIVGAVSAHPDDEALTLLLMTAFFRCGHRSEALRAYQNLRQQLSAGIGLEPSMPLRQAQQALLRGKDPRPDDALAVGAAALRR